MKGMATAYPEYAGRLQALCDRMFDLLKVVREHYYHPDFHGSYSIESVLLALVPTLNYEDLEIHNASMARSGFIMMTDPGTPEPERATGMLERIT